MDLLTDAMQAIGPYLPYAVLAGSAAAVLAGLVFLVWLIVRAVRTKRLDNLGTIAATLIATAFSAEGMWEVATEGLKMGPWQAAGLFAVLEVAMTSEAIRARRLMNQKKPYGIHAAAVWVIAAAAGGIAALNAALNAGDLGGLVEVPVRLCMPLLAAWLWWTELRSHRDPKATDTITWRLTVSRVLVKLRLAEPGSSDITTVDRAHRAGRIAVAAYRTHHATQVFHDWHARRLRKLTLEADKAIVDEACERLERVYSIEKRTAPEAFENASNQAGHEVREPVANAAANLPQMIRESHQDKQANGSQKSGSKPKDGSKKPRLTAEDAARIAVDRLTDDDDARSDPRLSDPKRRIGWIRGLTGCGASTGYKAIELLQLRFANDPASPFANHSNDSNEPIANGSNGREPVLANGSSHGREES